MTPDQYEAAVSVLELECRLMRARMDRLEDENRRLEEEVVQLRIQLHNATQAPARREWVSLTKDETTEIIKRERFWDEVLAAVDKELKEKNT